MQPPSCSRNFAEHLLRAGGKKGNHRAPSERYRNFRFQSKLGLRATTVFSSETAGSRYSLRHAWHKKTAEKWAPLPPPGWKNRFKLAPRVPKPRFKKLVKNCQRFSSFILFFSRTLFFFLSSIAPMLLMPLLCSRPMLLFSNPGTRLPRLSWVYPGKACHASLLAR